MVYERIKQQMMDTLPLVRTLGIRIDEIGNGTAKVSMPDDPKLHNHLGTPHAGALFTLAETASGAAMAGPGTLASGTPGSDRPSSGTAASGAASSAV